MLKDIENWYASWFDTPFYHILYKSRDDKEAGVLLNASIPKANAETLRGNDLIELLGKKWVVDTINKTTSVVTVKIDKPVPVQTGSSNPTNTD